MGSQPCSFLKLFLCVHLINNCWNQSNLEEQLLQKKCDWATTKTWESALHFCVILHCIAKHAIQILYCICCIAYIALYCIATAQCTAMQPFSAIATEFRF